MSDVPAEATGLETAAIAAYEAFRITATDRLGEIPPWHAIPPEARADWRAVADAVRMIAEPVIRAAERERFIAVLADHYLFAINCDHELKRDQAWCACSLVNLGWHESVGAAVSSWIDHVADLLRAEP